MGAKTAKSTAKSKLATRELEAGLDEAVVGIERVEICRAGMTQDATDNPRVIEANIIAALAANFEPDADRAPVTLDHADEGPAYGWIKKVWAEGESLFASLTQVPIRLANAIKNGRYAERSIEFFRNWKGTGKPKLTAVTFLGAALPAVDGMEPVKLMRCDDASPEIFSIPKSAFAETPTQLSAVPPEGASFGTINTDQMSGDTLGHCHVAYLDGDGNGFTGAPLSWDSERGGYGGPEDGHQHIVTAGAIQPADDENGTNHTHGLTTWKQTMRATAPKENIMDPNKPGNPESKPAVTPEQLAAVEARASKLDETVEKLRADNEKLQRDLFNRDQTAAFEKTWAECLGKGSVEPAAKDGELALFSALPADGENVIKLRAGDGKEREIGPRALFLENLKARPGGVVTLSRITGDAPERHEPVSPDTEPGAYAEKLSRLAAKIATDEKLPIERATVEADKRLRAAK